jgi:LPXTG-site transpeptidase (sortase) family protein
MYTKHMPKQAGRNTIHSAKFPMILIAIGLLLLSLWGVHRYFYNRSIGLSDAILARFAKESSSLPTPIHITVGNSISLPVVEAGKVNNMWAISQTAANHVRESAMPGTRGNIIIYAHNTANLFGPLDKVTEGNPIEIRTSDGALHRYTVTSVQWVTPGHTELLSPTPTETLTLYTCAGLLDSLRIVVRAVPV